MRRHLSSLYPDWGLCDMVGQMTGETIKSSIAMTIREFFKIMDGDNVTYPVIYKEQIVQDFEKPSFFVWTIDVSQRKEGRAYMRDYQMNIRYHPQEDDPNKFETLCQIGEELLSCLDYIQVPISTNGVTERTLPVKGSQMDFQIKDNILQFYVTYTIRVKKVESSIPLMKGLEINQI
jgi:hypothetical protein